MCFRPDLVFAFTLGKPLIINTDGLMHHVILLTLCWNRAESCIVNEDFYVK